MNNSAQTGEPANQASLPPGPPHNPILSQPPSSWSRATSDTKPNTKGKLKSILSQNQWIQTRIQNPFRKIRSKWRLPRKLRFTRDGKYFVLLTTGVGIAALNTGNNLLFLVLGMQLALIIVSGIMSEMSLRHLTVTRRLPPRAQAERSHIVEIEIHNKKKYAASYAVEVEDIRAEQPPDKRCFFLKIGPKSSQIAAYRRKPHRRGKDRHEGFRIATRYPFGLFEKSTRLHKIDELIVYPATDPTTIKATAPDHNQHSIQQHTRGNGSEIIGIRPMAEGDAINDIYWQKSTIPNQLVVKERARELKPNAHISLDDIRPSYVNHDVWNTDFEIRIREVASKTVAHIRKGSDVKLATTSGKTSHATIATGPDPILSFLALIEPIDTDPTGTVDPRGHIIHTGLPQSHPARETAVSGQSHTSIIWSEPEA